MNNVKPLVLKTMAVALMAASAAISAAPLQLLSAGGAPSVLAENHDTIQVAANLLRRDLDTVTGRQAKPIIKLEDCAQVCFVVGRYDSDMVAGIAKTADVDLTWLKGQWERYERVVITTPSLPGKHIVLIAGSDARGTAYGVVDVTREIGVSAWEWWADAIPRKNSNVAIDDERIQSAAPSVAYRGIFLNDEDWGLQPWAAKHDPVGDIGPTTYARIFELMMRLKANLIWPAMHDSTKPFYQIPGNAAVAKQYGIVVGTSHAEPMMRNNVREWDHSKRGDFNYFTNRQSLIDYWGERADEVKEFENIYSVGIRGVHDTGMEGAPSVVQARDAVHDVINIERGLLSKAQGKPAEQIPQALTLYKEVLDIYKAGLKVPEDVTLLWPDDNYGYLHQLSTPDEAKRSGGTGLYYHLSYWGRPHDYLWLGTTHPELVRDQLQRAVATNTRKIWVVNVGDIKPIEYLTQYFLDAAFDASKLNKPAQEHLKSWIAEQFGAKDADAIAAVLRDYYDLAWERRPEFMGFSQVETITTIRQSDYLVGGGEEAEQRNLRYTELVNRARMLGKSLPPHLQEAYFQLVLYPVQSSANLNARILKLDLAAQYAREGRQSASLYAKQAQEAQRAIGRDTAQYNAMGKGKWRGMMDAAPRKLPVFDEPLFPTYAKSTRAGCALRYPTPLSVHGESISFVRGKPGERVVTLVNYGASTASWSVASMPEGLSLNISSGKLNETAGFEQRITVRYDGKGTAETFKLQCGRDIVTAKIKFERAEANGLIGEVNGIVALPAAEGIAEKGWSLIPGLGSYGNSMRADFAVPSRTLDQSNQAPALSYKFSTESSAQAQINFVGLPVHALTSANKVRMAYSLDGAAPQLLDFETRGRSDEWKVNVLSNTAVRSIRLPSLAAGPHTLRVFALDPGVVLDRIEIRFDGAPSYYGKPL